MGSSVPSFFHPIIAKWFSESVGAPTDVQLEAWNALSGGGHVLVTAPTGCGKTFAAFLWAIDRLVTGAWPVGGCRVLYVSPMKALNNDVRKNLLGPLENIRALLTASGHGAPPVTVMSRSGDTAPAERRAMLKHPPQVLITTPESLNILLSSAGGRSLLSGLKTVILDEVHSVLGTKRGVHLITAVERLTLLCGEFQRIALSATVRPLDMAADFIGGYLLRNGGYVKREVRVVRSGLLKAIELSVTAPPTGGDHPPGEARQSVWERIAAELKGIIRENRSTLVFVNSRRLAERMARLINEGEGEILAYSHHGSISKEMRLAVEDKLKKGGLKAIVATSSLELGIDIGDLDRVVLVQTPGSIASAVQRVGRSGHRVGAVSRGVLYPSHGMDFLDAASAARAAVEKDIEPFRPVLCPLDVLAQVILSMAVSEEWDLDRLFDFVRTAWPYRGLDRRQFDLVVEMLSGRYAGSKAPELGPRIYRDKIDNRIKAREGAGYRLFLSGGTIPDRGYYELRHKHTRARIGELDEEFVWERKVGENIAMETQVWRIESITDSAVEVVPAASPRHIIPFWKADESYRDFHFSQKVLDFLEWADGALSGSGFAERLLREHGFDGRAAGELRDFLIRQKESSGASLPHRRHVLVERCRNSGSSVGRSQLIIHTLWGSRLNKPLALAIEAAMAEKFSIEPEVMSGNDCVAVMLPEGMEDLDVFGLFGPDDVEPLIRRVLEKSGFFGARFRENAARALLVTRNDFRRRTPLWITRLRSRKLMGAVMGYSDFPILLETWRECFADFFDLSGLKAMLDEIASGAVQVSRADTKTPSVFAANMIYAQINRYLYMDDTPSGGKLSSLSDEILKDVIRSDALRPGIPPELARDWEARAQRTAPGFAPDGPDDLLAFVIDRLLVPQDEWAKLAAAMSGGADIIAPVMAKLAGARVAGTGAIAVAAVENLPALEDAFGRAGIAFEILPFTGMDDAGYIGSALEKLRGEEIGLAFEDFLLQWLSFYAPLGLDRLAGFFGDCPGLHGALASLADKGLVVTGALTAGPGRAEICAAANLEILLRIFRRKREPGFQALPLEKLQPFLASWQGVAGGKGSSDGLRDALRDALDRLFGWPASPADWEGFIFPSRLEPYHEAWLDSLLQNTGLCWYGCGVRQASFAFRDDLELFLERDDSSGGGALVGEGVLPGEGGRFSFFEIARRSGLSTEKLADELWDLLWKGRVQNDSFDTLRKGIMNKFAAFQPDKTGTSGRRGARSRWESSRPLAGYWSWTEIPEERDILGGEDLDRDRARQLFSRYGVVFRELLANELPPLQWGRLFRALRTMELSGEILSGHFFDGIPGLQFISPEALRSLEGGLPEDRVYCLNAADPASLAGIGLDALRGVYPRRVSSNAMVFLGCGIVLVSERGGRSLEIKVGPGHPQMGEFLAALRLPLLREFNPEKSIFVETINGEPAGASPYLQDFLGAGFTRAYKGLEMRKKY